MAGLYQIFSQDFNILSTKQKTEVGTASGHGHLLSNVQHRSNRR